MGEHVTLDGEVAKLGTCEGLYYVRFADLVQWLAEGRLAKRPGNLEPSWYVVEKYGFWYRFPFPDEDHLDRPWGIGEPGGPAFDRGWPLLVDGRHLPVMSHGMARLSMEGSFHPLAALVPCPQGVAAPTVSWVGQGLGNLRYIEVVNQKLDEGRLATIVRCPFCQQFARLAEDEAQALAAGTLIRNEADHTVLARMVAGYRFDAAAVTL